MSDLDLLKDLLDDHADDLSDKEVEAFADMRFTLKMGTYGSLTKDQREWVQRVHERIVPQYSNLVSQGLVPRGREVPTPEVLRNLPKKPPTRKRDDK